MRIEKIRTTVIPSEARNPSFFSGKSEEGFLASLGNDEWITR